MSESALQPAPIVRSRPAIIALWLLQIVLAAAFLGAGSAKLAGAAPMVAMYEAIGVGQWFRYVTSIFEIGGAIGLLMPSAAALAAPWLMCIMAGAIITHLIRPAQFANRARGAADRIEHRRICPAARDRNESGLLSRLAPRAAPSG